MASFDVGVTGLVGTVGLSINLEDGSEFTPRFTSGITEIGYGSYFFPTDTSRTLIYEWDTGLGTPTSTETIYAVGSVPAGDVGGGTADGRMPTSLTLSDARQLVLDTINENAGAVFSYNKIDNLLNQGIRTVLRGASDFVSKMRITTIDGQKSYRLDGADIKRGNASVLGATFNGRDLTPAAHLPLTTAESTPTKFSVENDVVYLYGTPNLVGSLEVSYMREFEDMRNGDDPITVPRTYLDVAVLYAAYMLKLMDEEYTSAGMFRSQYQDSLMNATTLATGVYAASEEYNYE